MPRTLKEYVQNELERTANEILGGLQSSFDIDDGFVGFDSPNYQKYIEALDALSESLIGILKEQVIARGKYEKSN